VFLGAAINPFAPPHDFRPHRLAKKIAAGAQFVQSQYCYDVPMFRRYMQQVRDMGLDRECFILCGVGPLASARTAKWMRSNVPGVHIPTIIERLEGAQDQKAEGKQHLHRHHQRGQGDRRRLRHSCDGLPAGRVRCRDRP
jgi:5,10-methylenetetrahydrofolate reductase